MARPKPSSSSAQKPQKPATQQNAQKPRKPHRSQKPKKSKTSKKSQEPHEPQESQETQKLELPEMPEKSEEPERRPQVEKQEEQQHHHCHEQHQQIEQQQQQQQQKQQHVPATPHQPYWFIHKGFGCYRLSPEEGGGWSKPFPMGLPSDPTARFPPPALRGWVVVPQGPYYTAGQTFGLHAQAWKTQQELNKAVVTERSQESKKMSAPSSPSGSVVSSVVSSSVSAPERRVPGHGERFGTGGIFTRPGKKVVKMRKPDPEM